MSFGQLALGGSKGVGGFGEGVGGFGDGGHDDGGGGGQPFGVWVDVTKVKKRRLKVRRKAVVAKALEAIFKCFGFLQVESVVTQFVLCEDMRSA